MAGRTKPPSRVRTRLLLLALLAVLAVAGTALDVLVVFPAARGPGGDVPREIEIPPGAGPKQLAALLAEAGAVNSPGRFALWLRLSGRLPEIRAGRFSLEPGLNAARIVDTLAGRGGAPGTRVTIPEGFTLSRIAETLERAGVCPSAEFLSAAMDSGLLDELGIPGASAEGFLFPDTYFLDPGAAAADVIRRMHGDFARRFSALAPGDADPGRTVTLASIVQLEAAVAEELPVIAGVYANRLESPAFPSRLLNADPTVAYGCESWISPRAPSCEGFTGVLSRRQLDDAANPYNTYRHPGLPPGPISAPGSAALEAALRPARVPYFYFVACGGEGRHAFSVTYEEHRRAVERCSDPGGTGPAPNPLPGRPAP
jgi:UPF0755 protein